MMGEWDTWWVVDSYQGVGGGTGGGYYLRVFFNCAFVFCALTFFIPLTRSYWGIEIVASVT